MVVQHLMGQQVQIQFYLAQELQRSLLSVAVTVAQLEQQLVPLLRLVGQAAQAVVAAQVETHRWVLELVARVLLGRDTLVLAAAHTTLAAVAAVQAQLEGQAEV